MKKSERAINERIAEAIGCPLPPPNYTNDLNACRLFEETLVWDSLSAMNYGFYLGKIVERDAPRGQRALIAGWHASAPQRCEAFLQNLDEKEREAKDPKWVQGPCAGCGNEFDHYEGTERCKDCGG